MKDSADRFDRVIRFAQPMMQFYPENISKSGVVFREIISVDFLRIWLLMGTVHCRPYILWTQGKRYFNRNLVPPSCAATSGC